MINMIVNIDMRVGRNVGKICAPVGFLIFTGRNEVVAKVIFLQVSVIHSVHRGGGVSDFFGVGVGVGWGRGLILGEWGV